MSETPRNPEDRTQAGAAGADETTEQRTADQPTVNMERGLPTSDPVFPTASPELKPPRPADVSGFGAPAGAGSGMGPQRDISPAAGSTKSSAPEPGAAPGPAPGSAAGVGSPVPATGGVSGPLPPGPPRQRTAAEIRADIEAGRQQLSESVELLRDRVDELTDWRGQLRKHRREITIAAAAVGFVIGARFMMKRRRR